MSAPLAKAVESQRTVAPRFTARPNAAVEEVSLISLGWFVTTHVVTLLFLVSFASWKVYFVTLGLHTVFGVSITLGAHRYFSHKAFTAPAWLENALALLYTLSFDRCGEGIISWGRRGTNFITLIPIASLIRIRRSAACGMHTPGTTSRGARTSTTSKTTVTIVPTWRGGPSSCGSTGARR